MAVKGEKVVAMVVIGSGNGGESMKGEMNQFRPKKC